MKEFYRKEKERLGIEWKMSVGIVMFFFLIIFQQQAVSEPVFQNERPDMVLYTLPIQVISFLVAIYLPYSVFFIKERNETVFLWKKYEAVPISKKHYYQTKMKLIAEKSLWFVAETYLVYFFVSVANKLSPFSIEAMRGVFIQMAILSGTMVAFLLAGWIEQFFRKS